MAQDASIIPCGNIKFVGCCADSNHSKYCSATKGLVTKDCTLTPSTPKCGWDSTKSYYTCVATTSGDTDPSGTNPRLCTDIPDGGVPSPDKGVKPDAPPAVPCGTVTGKGCCRDDNATLFCLSGSLATKDCTKAPNTPKCGWDSAKNYYTCGTGGQADPAGTYPRLCDDLPDGGASVSDKGVKLDGRQPVPCGKIPQEGCCLDDNATQFCVNGSLATRDCTQGTNTPKCGWKTSGYFCGTDGAADPTNTFPRLCSAYTSDGGGGARDRGLAVDKGSLTKSDVGSSSKNKSSDGCACEVATTPGAGGMLGLLLALSAALLLGRRRSR
jgi:MYXO-CTERM domain-containing protein